MSSRNIEYLYSDFFFRVRSIFFSALFKKSTGYLKYLSPAVDNLNKKGYYKIESFYSNDQIAFVNTIFDNVINDLNLESSKNFAIEKAPGEIKIKNVQEQLRGIKSLSCETFFSLLSFAFNFKLKFPSVLFHLVHDGSYPNKENIPGVSGERISGNYHYDDFKPILKVIVLLDDLNDKIGAQTSIIPSSARDKRVQKFLFNKTQTIDKKIVDDLILEKGIVNCYGKKGDIYILDTRNIHWGEKLKAGYRRLMWYYF